MSHTGHVVINQHQDKDRGWTPGFGGLGGGDEEEQRHQEVKQVVYLCLLSTFCKSDLFIPVRRVPKTTMGKMSEEMVST